jgi:hypothetical protein
VLVAAVLHFPELDADLEVLGSKHSAGLIDDEVDALWSHVRATRTRWRCTFLLRSPVTLLTTWGSSGGSLYR